MISCGGIASKDKKRGRGLKRSKHEQEVGWLQHQHLNDTYNPDSPRLPVCSSAGASLEPPAEPQLSPQVLDAALQRVRRLLYQYWIVLVISAIHEYE